jgi:hypothetical protein
MGLLFRLPFLLLEALLRRVLGRDDQDERFAPQSASPVAPTSAPVSPFAAAAPSANGTPPPPTAEEALSRSIAREQADLATADLAAADADDLTPPTPLRPAGDTGHVSTEPELVESFGPSDDVGDVGGTITVAEPWDGYAAQPAAAIVARLRGADPATKAVVALYERGHKNRATVLRATG